MDEVFAVHEVERRGDLGDDAFGEGLAEAVVAHVGRQIAERREFLGEKEVAVALEGAVVRFQHGRVWAHCHRKIQFTKSFHFQKSSHSQNQRLVDQSDESVEAITSQAGQSSHSVPWIPKKVELLLSFEEKKRTHFDGVSAVFIGRIRGPVRRENEHSMKGSRASRNRNRRGGRLQKTSARKKPGNLTGFLSYFLFFYCFFFPVLDSGLGERTRKELLEKRFFFLFFLFGVERRESKKKGTDGSSCSGIRERIRDARWRLC